jgi:hypothetical protein
VRGIAAQRPVLEMDKMVITVNLEYEWIREISQPA